MNAETIIAINGNKTVTLKLKRTEKRRYRLAQFTQECDGEEKTTCPNIFADNYENYVSAAEYFMKTMGCINFKIQEKSPVVQVADISDSDHWSSSGMAHANFC